MYVFDTSWYFPLLNGIDLLAVHLQPFSGDDETEVFDFFDMELSFVDVEVHAGLFEFL